MSTADRKTTEWPFKHCRTFSRLKIVFFKCLVATNVGALIVLCVWNHNIHSIAKLAGLVIKTLAKPLSKRIKHEFSRTQAGTYALGQIGQFSHQVTSRMTIWSAGYKVRTIAPLADDKAVQIGSEFVGESFILIVSSGVVIYEYNRSKVKEQEKYEQQRLQAEQERQELQTQLNAIYIRLNAMEDSLLLLQTTPNEEEPAPTVESAAPPPPSILSWLSWRRSPN